MCVLGFTMFRYPQAWAKGNAYLARKELKEFDSPRQLEHTKRLGIALMVLFPLSLVTVLWSDAVLRLAR